MNIRPLFLTSVLGLAVLPGCELLLLPLLPVAMPIAYIHEQSEIVQPVTVVSSSGRQLTPDFEDVAEETFTVSRATVVCNGFHPLYESTSEVSLVCDKGLKGKMVIQKFTSREIKISIGPKSAPGADNGSYGYLTEVTFRCNGYYNTPEDRVDPFIAKCGTDGKAAVSPVGGGAVKSEFKVWINPPS